MKTAKEAELEQSASDPSSPDPDPDSISKQWDLAYELYRTGKMEQAEVLLRGILENAHDHLQTVKLLGAILFSSKGPQAAQEYIERAGSLKPNDPDCCNNLGSLRWAQGRLNEAASCFQQTVSLDPGHVRAQANLGNVLTKLGYLEQAEKAYAVALGLEPGAAEIHDSLGTLLQARGDIPGAVVAHRKAVELSPKVGTYHANLANVLEKTGLRDSAIQACQQAIDLEPQRADFYLNLGGLLHSSGRLDEAITAFRKVLRLQPESGLAFNNLAGIFREQGRIEDALAMYQTASELEPDSHVILYNYGATLHRLKRYEEAISVFQRVLTLKPDWADAYVNLGNAQYEQGYTDEVLEVYDKAILLDDTIAQAHRNRALVLQKLGRWGEALDAFNRAISISPDDPLSHAAKGMLQLKLGDFKAGWQEYEWRFEAMGFDYLPASAYQTPPWEGQSFKGKALLVYHEQGLGDALQLTGYLPMVKALGGAVNVLCGPPLMRLLESQPFVDSTLSRRENQKLSYDFHVPLMSLPRIFGTTLDTIPTRMPYLDVDPELVKNWAKRIPQTSTLKVGLVWSGNPDQGDDRYRSCTLKDYAPLARVEGVDFFSLQVGEGAKQVEHPPEMMQIFDYTTDLHDFSETAALIKNLDLVITVDTSVAHLAGAIEQPVWTVLWFNSCFRYLLDRADSPWYPSMRLFRQPAIGDWSSVMEQVANELAKRAEEHPMFSI